MEANRFSDCAQKLLQAAVICEYTDPDNYKALTDDSYLNEINEFLSKIDRRVASTSDGAAFFLSYADATEPNAKSAIRSQFKDTANHLHAVIKFMQLARECSSLRNPIQPGDILSEGELITALEASPALGNQLIDLTKFSRFKSQASDNVGRLRNVLSQLDSEGYISRLEPKSSKYRATGRWSMIYDVLRFIQANLQLDEEPPQQDQRGLF